MLPELTVHIRHCFDRAADARRRAHGVVDQDRKARLQDIEQSWRCLAQSFEQLEKIEQFLIGEDPAAATAWAPIESAPFDCDLQLAVIVNGEAHALAFPCRRTPGGWLKAPGNQRLDVSPSHWREWKEG
jgi:hypothetical protein